MSTVTVTSLAKLRSALSGGANTIIVKTINPFVIGNGQSLRIERPLKLIGLKAKLSREAVATPILIIDAPSATKENPVIVEGDASARLRFELDGKDANPPTKKRKSLIEVRSSHCVIQDGIVRNSSKNGIEVNCISHDSVSDVYIGGIDGYDNEVDVVALESRRDSPLVGNDFKDDFEDKNKKTAQISDCHIAHIAGYRSKDAGVVEISDGAKDITVIGIDGYDCKGKDGTVVSIQRHKRPYKQNFEGKITLKIIEQHGCKGGRAVLGLSLDNADKGDFTATRDFDHITGNIVDMH